jgi:tetratricopeptide (TPR) repeat protein
VEIGPMNLMLILVTGIFIVLLIVLAIFVAQQLSAIQQVQTKQSMSLSEKLNAGGINPLDSDRFREMTMGGAGIEDPNLLVNLSEQSSLDQGSVISTPADSPVETPEESAFFESNISQDFQDIEKKDIQALYSEYLTAKSLRPFDVEPEFKLGLAYIKNAQYEKAQNLFQKVTESKPDFPGVFYYLGESYRCNGQFYEAMQAYKQSWEMDHLQSESEADETKDDQNDII